MSFFGGMTFRRSPKYGYGTSNDDEMTAVLADLTTIPAIAFPVHVTPEALDESVEMEKNRAIYGVGNQWSNNPVAALSENGSYTTKGRTGLVTTTVDYDCSSFAKGLKSTTFLGLNLYQMTRIGQNPDYYGYLWDRQMGVGAISAHKGAKESGKSLMDKYTYQSLNFYECLSYDFARNGHRLGVTAAYYLSSVARTGRAVSTASRMRSDGLLFLRRPLSGRGRGRLRRDRRVSARGIATTFFPRRVWDGFCLRRGVHAGGGLGSIS